MIQVEGMAGQGYAAWPPEFGICHGRALNAVYFNDRDREFHRTFDDHLDVILGAFKAREEPPIHARAGYRALALAYAAIASYETGRRVDVADAVYRA